MRQLPGACGSLVKRLLVLVALGACSDPPAVTPDAEVLPSVLPAHLSQTGLYTDFRAKTLAPGFIEFVPANVLWSDGAVKHRWYKLPAGATIDSTDMNHWKAPVGTKFSKKVSRDGKRVETRLIWR